MFTSLRLRSAALGAWIRTHRLLSGVIVVIIVSVLGFIYMRVFSGSDTPRYMLGTVSSTTIASVISGSGQVTSSNELEVKPKVSGDITSILVTPGQKVSAGAVIARIDSSDAQKAVRDAETNLESAQIALEKLQKPAEGLSLLQSENAVTSAEDALQKRYDDSRIDVSDAFLDFPDIIESLKNIEIGTDSNRQGQWNIDYYFNAISMHDSKAKTYRDDAYAAYVKARASYDAAFARQQAMGSAPSDLNIESLLTDTNATTQDLLDAVSKATAFIQLYEDVLELHDQEVSSAATNALTQLNTYTGTINSHLSALLADKNGLKSDKQSLSEKKASLADTRSGADSLDIRSAQLSVTKAQNALNDTRADLGDYTVRAPFAGVIGSVGVKRYDSAGTATVLATLITDQKMAELSMNEVDVAKLEVGQKAELTFDAIDDLKIAGSVAEIDTIGVVDQGVVSYVVKIGFDSQDSRIKTGMTVNADIEIDVAADVMAVPASAVKSLNGRHFVLAFDPPLELAEGSRGAISTKQVPRQIPVEAGITDDTNTEIVSGLELDQQIVIRQITGTTPSTTQAPSIFGSPSGGTRASGGAVRIQR